MSCSWRACCNLTWNINTIETRHQNELFKYTQTWSSCSSFSAEDRISICSINLFRCCFECRLLRYVYQAPAKATTNRVISVASLIWFELSFGEPKRTTSMALTAIFCRWIGSLIPRTAEMYWTLFTASLKRNKVVILETDNMTIHGSRTVNHLGSLVPSMPCCWNNAAYCGSCTKWLSHSAVCSIVQLCTSERVHMSQSSRTEMCISSSRWKAFCRRSCPPS